MQCFYRGKRCGVYTSITRNTCYLVRLAAPDCSISRRQEFPALLSSPGISTFYPAVAAHDCIKGFLGGKCQSSPVFLIVWIPGGSRGYRAPLNSVAWCTPWKCFFWFSLWPEGNTKYRTVRTVNSRAEFIINSSAVHFTQSIEIAFGSQPPKELVWLSKLTIGRASHVAGGGAETDHSGVLFHLGSPRDQWRTRTLWTVWACWVSSPFVVCLSSRELVYMRGPPGACLWRLLLSILNCLKAVWVWFLWLD